VTVGSHRNCSHCCPTCSLHISKLVHIDIVSQIATHFEVPHGCGKAPFRQPVLKVPLCATLWYTACWTCSGCRLWDGTILLLHTSSHCTAALSPWRYREHSRAKGSILKQSIYLVFVTHYSTIILSDNCICHLLPAVCRLNLSDFLYRAHGRQAAAGIEGNLLDQIIWKKCLWCQRLGLQHVHLEGYASRRMNLDFVLQFL
jgi:hypothetical protein